MLRAGSLISPGLTKAIRHGKARHVSICRVGSFPCAGSPSVMCAAEAGPLGGPVHMGCVCPGACLECGIHKGVRLCPGWWPVCVCASLLCDHFPDSEFASATLSFEILALCLVLYLVLFPFPCVILWVIQGHLSPLVRPPAPADLQGLAWLALASSQLWPHAGSQR